MSFHFYSFTYSFIQLLNKYLLSIYYEPSPILYNESIKLSKIGPLPFLSKGRFLDYQWYIHSDIGKQEEGMTDRSS